MPLNEASGFTRSGLTREQKQQQEAAIYGLDKGQMAPNTSPLTPDEIERMRAIVAQADQSSGKVNSFDLNSPPKLPYRHQEFPRAVYDHENGAHRTARNQAHLDELVEAGYSLESLPADADAAQPELDAETAAEAAAIDAQLVKTRKAAPRKAAAAKD